MTERNISIQDRSKLFAVRVIKAYVELNKRHFDDAGKVLSKQFLRSGTSIGAIIWKASSLLRFFASSLLRFFAIWVP